VWGEKKFGFHQGAQQNDDQNLAAYGTKIMGKCEEGDPELPI